MRDVVLLGSTGSIGTQAIDVVRRNPDRFRVVGIAAGGADVDLLARQALELGVEVVAVAKATAAQDLQLAFYAAAQAARLQLRRVPGAQDPGRPGRRDRAGRSAWPCDVVLNGMTGSIGLAPTLAALRRRPHAGAGQQGVAHRRRAAGQGGRQRPGQIVPVDSEHSALAQCLRGGRRPTRSAGWC